MLRVNQLIGFGSGRHQLAIAGTPVLSATEDAAYTGFTATASGGTTPYVYSLVGSWPAGLSINSSSGAVSGTPTLQGTYASLSVRVTDAALATADLPTFTITVAVAAATRQAMVPGGYINSNGPRQSMTPFGYINEA